MTKILVVDDSPLDRQIVGGLLEKNKDAEVVFAMDGEEGLKAVVKQSPDLVLTDLQMPKLDGLQLVTEMKQKHPLIPVILMTSAGSEEVAVKALKAGAATYVSKKRLGLELSETVRSVLEVSGEQKRHARALMRLNRWEADFTVESDIELVMTISTYLMQSFAAMELCDPGEQVRVGVALAEALLNAYYHGNLQLPQNLRENSREEYVKMAERRVKEAPYKDRKIQITARFSRGHAIFSVRDEGDGFDASKVANPLDPKSMDRTHGRGLLLMRTFMDEVKFNDKGNHVTMIKKAAAKQEPVSPVPEPAMPSIKSRKVVTAY